MNVVQAFMFPLKTHEVKVLNWTVATILALNTELFEHVVLFSSQLKLLHIVVAKNI